MSDIRCLICGDYRCDGLGLLCERNARGFKCLAGSGGRVCCSFGKLLSLSSDGNEFGKELIGLGFRRGTKRAARIFAFDGGLVCNLFSTSEIWGNRLIDAGLHKNVVAVVGSNGQTSYSKML